MNYQARTNNSQKLKRNRKHINIQSPYRRPYLAQRRQQHDGHLQTSGVLVPRAFFQGPSSWTRTKTSAASQTCHSASVVPSFCQRAASPIKLSILLKTQCLLVFVVFRCICRLMICILLANCWPKLVNQYFRMVTNVYVN